MFIVMYVIDFFVLIGNGIFKDYFYFTIDSAKGTIGFDPVCGFYETFS